MSTACLFTSAANIADTKSLRVATFIVENKSVVVADADVRLMILAIDLFIPLWPKSGAKQLLEFHLRPTIFRFLLMCAFILSTGIRHLIPRHTKAHTVLLRIGGSRSGEPKEKR